MLAEIAAAELTRLRTEQVDVDLARWRCDPCAFAEEVFGITLWGRQREMLRAICAHDRVAVRAGRKVSKSHTAALAGWWHFFCHPRGRVVFTAPTYRQIEKVLWHEVRSLWRLARDVGRLQLPRPAQRASTGLQVEDGREMVGISTNETEAFAGYSGAGLFYVVDEASGYDEGMLATIRGNLGGGGKLLMCSNPTRPSGTFYEAFHGKRDLWCCIHISSEESPNVTGKAVIPGLAIPDWIEEMRDEWGTESPLYSVHVLGNFPSESANAVIALWAIKASQELWEGLDVGPLVLGVDVARYGDDETIIAPRRGQSVGALIPFRPSRDDGRTAEEQIAERVEQVALELKRGQEHISAHIDANGVGAGVVSALRASTVLRVFGVYGSDAADGEANQLRFRNKRAQMWFGAGEWLKGGGTLPEDPRLAAELAACEYKYDAQNRYQLEAKEELKKRIRRSPDRADAVVLSIYQMIAPRIRPPAKAVNRRLGGRRGFG